MEKWIYVGSFLCGVREICEIVFLKEFFIIKLLEFKFKWEGSFEMCVEFLEVLFWKFFFV